MHGADFLTGPGGLLNPNVTLATFILFCRIGACLMFMPGVSSAPIPVQVRLFVAVAVTLSLAPILLDQAPLKSLSDDPIPVLRMIVVESLVGAVIGLLGRFFYLALETMTVGASTMLGMANPFGVELEQGEVMQPLAQMVTLSATALIFMTNMHWEVLRGLVASYHAIPLGSDFDTAYSLRHLVDILGDTFRVALRVCSPFFIYAVIVNFAMSIINRLAPQVSIFYIITPFVVAGGLVLLYFSIRSLLVEFMASFGAWLLSG